MFFFVCKAKLGLIVVYIILLVIFAYAGYTYYQTFVHVNALLLYRFAVILLIEEVLVSFFNVIVSK